jgi:hypothetical protein
MRMAEPANDHDAFLCQSTENICCKASQNPNNSLSFLSLSLHQIQKPQYLTGKTAYS